MKQELLNMLKKALEHLYQKDIKNIEDDVSERCLCERIALHLENVIRNQDHSEKYKNYFVDIEYNRMDGKKKKLIQQKSGVKSVVCDLLLHSRGMEKHDNYIALEMKKANNNRKKNDDKERLLAMTELELGNPTDHVCNTILGVFLTVYGEKVTLDLFEKGKQVETIVYNYISNTKTLECSS